MSAYRKIVQRIACLLVFIFCCKGIATAQVICVHCFDQNERVEPAGVDLVANGGFEAGSCAPGIEYICPNSSAYACDIPDWICTGGGTSTYAAIETSSFSIVPEGARTVYMGNFFCQACSPAANDTSCLSPDGCMLIAPAPGYPVNFPEFGDSTGVSLEQTVTGLAVGSPYVLEFWAGGEFAGAFSQLGIFAIDVGFGKIFVRCRPTGAGSADVGTRYVIVFNAVSTAQTIRFTNWGHISIWATELVVDDVRLLPALQQPCETAIPAPQLGALPRPYPNPFSNTLNLADAGQGEVTFALHDAFGRLVAEEVFSGDCTLNTEALASGLYSYVLTANGRTARGKVVKE